MNEPAIMRETPVWLSRYTRFTALSTLFLIYAGAMVTSTGSGLAVPDWPLSYGMLFPPMVGGIFYEHGHRMVAATVGLLTVIQAVWLQKCEPLRFVLVLGWIAVLVVILQGVLGGITVLFFLPTAVSVSHAALAEIFLALNVSIAFFTSVSFRRLREAETTAPRRTVLAARALVAVGFAQILAGAVMRHLGAGLAIPDFPLSNGRLIPEMTSTGIAVNYLHRVGAVLYGTLIVALTPAMFRLRSGFVRGVYSLLLVTLVAQVTLGGLTVWSAKNPVITSVHVVTGASMLALSVLIALSIHTMDRERAPVVNLAGREVPA